MNIPKAIEIAFCDVMRQHSQLGEGVVLRAFQALDADGSWTATGDRKFPCVDVRCAPATVTEGQCTCFAECSILFCSKIDDDRNHATISGLYEAGQATIDAMFSQARKRSDGAELSQFKADLSSALGTDFEFSGLLMSDPVAPYTEAGISIIGLRVRVVFIRKDFI